MKESQNICDGKMEWESDFFPHTLNNGKFYNCNFKMDLLWSRLLLPCIDVEQKNWGFFCICHLNWLGFFSLSLVRAVTERGQEVRANPASTQGRTQWKIAQIHHFQCGNQWGHEEKWGLPSISWQSQFPLMSLSQGQKDTRFSAFPKHFSFLKLTDLLQFIAMTRTKHQMVLTKC